MCKDADYTESIVSMHVKVQRYVTTPVELTLE